MTVTFAKMLARDHKLDAIWFDLPANKDQKSMLTASSIGSFSTIRLKPRFNLIPRFEHQVFNYTK